MLSMLSTVAFFVAAYYAKRQLAEMGIAKGMTRGLIVFVWQQPYLTRLHSRQTA